MSDILTDKCINIIKNNTPETAIKKISSLKKIYKKDKIGDDLALKIYNVYADKKIDYDVKKYANNESDYQKKINNNIKKASSYINKSKNG